MGCLIRNVRLLQRRSRRRRDLRLAPNLFHEQFPLQSGVSKLPALYTLPTYDFDLRATHARTLLPAALASVSFEFVLVRVRVL